MAQTMTSEIMTDPTLADNQPDAPEPNHCPFGCEQADLKEFGYCPHLVGFTNDGKKFEPIEPILDKNGNPRDFLRVNGKKIQPILKTDVLVNPIRRDNGNPPRVWKAWVSSRVYRQIKEAAAKA